MTENNLYNNTMSTLYVTATPIGNLEDITLRAIRVLSEVDIILAEDTRHFAKLKSHLEASQNSYYITANIVRFDQHTESTQLTKIISQLDEGKAIALISDAGTPLLSDPGFLLIKTIQTHTSHEVVPIPGVSAVTAALSVSGLPPYPFNFLGFLPTKNAKLNKLLESALKIHAITPTTFVAFEAPQRLTQTIHTANTFCLQNNARISLTLANELTKLHEKVIPLHLPVDEPENFKELRGESTLVWRFN